MLNYKQLLKLVEKDYVMYIPRPTDSIASVCYGQGHNMARDALMKYLEEERLTITGNNAILDILRNQFIGYAERINAEEVGTNEFWRCAGAMQYLNNLRHIGQFEESAFSYTPVAAVDETVTGVSF